MPFSVAFYNTQARHFVAARGADLDEQDSYANLFYGTLDDGSVMFSNCEPVLRAFCSEAFPVAPFTYYEDGKFTTYRHEAATRTDDAGIRQNYLNARDIIESVNGILERAAQDALQESIDASFESYFKTLDPARKVAQFVDESFDDELRAQIVDVIQQQIDGLCTRERIDAQLDRSYRERFDAFIEKTAQPQVNVIKLNDVPVAETSCAFYHDKYEQVLTQVRLDERIMHALDMSFDVQRTFHDYVGFAPDVKAYLEGSPLTMVNKPNPPRKGISVYMNTSYDSMVQRGQIFHRGATVLTAIKILELLHYSVDLHLFEMSYCDMGDGTMEVHFSEFALKAPGERVNVQKLFFPLCHPSWIRRLNFRLIETTPDIAYQWAGTYGFPCGTQLMKKVLPLGEGEVLVPTIDELGIEGVDIVEDARRMFACFNRALPEADHLKLKRR